MSTSFEFDTPEVFTAGTIGDPGQRVFFLQVRHRGSVASLKLEKEQVRALAQVLRGMLEELPTPDDIPLGDLDLEEPVIAEWIVSSIGVGYDKSNDRVLVVAEEAVPSDPDADGDTDTDPRAAAPELPPDSDDAASVRVLLTRGQVLAFVDRADEVVAGGRPPCPWCGRPVDLSRPCVCLN